MITQADIERLIAAAAAGGGRGDQRDIVVQIDGREIARANARAAPPYEAWQGTDRA